MVFFGLLAIFPAVTALVSSYGLFADPATIGANLQTLAMMLPEGSFQIVQDQIARVLAKGPAALGGTFLFGLALALWSANAGVKAIIDALNVAHEENAKAQLHPAERVVARVYGWRHRGAAADGERGGGISAGVQSYRHRSPKAASSLALPAGRCCLRG